SLSIRRLLCGTFPLPQSLVNSLSPATRSCGSFTLLMRYSNSRPLCGSCLGRVLINRDDKHGLSLFTASLALSLFRGSRATCPISPGCQLNLPAIISPPAKCTPYDAWPETRVAP